MLDKGLTIKGINFIHNHPPSPLPPPKTRLEGSKNPSPGQSLCTKPSPRDRKGSQKPQPRDMKLENFTNIDTESRKALYDTYKCMLIIFGAKGA